MKKLNENKDLLKAIGKISHYTLENFIADAKTYIKATKERRMLCVIESVSKSGMSRVIKFNSCERSKTGYWYRQYSCLFKTLNYSPAKNSDGFRINGCGMDMVFHTNYTIIHRLHNLNFITKEECSKLAQQTPVKL